MRGLNRTIDFAYGSEQPDLKDNMCRQMPSPRYYSNKLRRDNKPRTSLGRYVIENKC